MLPGTMLLSQVLLFARRVGGKRKIFSTLPGLSAHGSVLSRSSLAAVNVNDPHLLSTLFVSLPLLELVAEFLVKTGDQNKIFLSLENGASMTPGEYPETGGNNF